MLKEIILIGGGGHCRACIDVIEKEGKYTIIGILDKSATEQDALSYPILGGDDAIPNFVRNDTYFLITVGQIKTYLIREKLAKILKKNNAKLATVISPLAYVSKYAKVGEGTIVMHKAILNANASVGDHCIINTLANIEHDVKIEDYCHISTGTIVNGNSKIEFGSFVGSNATITNNIVVKKESIIGAGTFFKG
jgi:sugar O-acyltransferase (sialic acid O-acetyltransferase NeuD family)